MSTQTRNCKDCSSPFVTLGKRGRPHEKCEKCRIKSKKEKVTSV